MRSAFSSPLSHEYESYLSRIGCLDLRLVCFAAAILIYALFGAPTPDSFSIIEILVGGLLLLAIGVGGFSAAIRRQSGGMWLVFGQVFLFYGFFVGGMGAIFSGADVVAVMRDLIPFGFMFLPLFMTRFWRLRHGFSFVLGAFIFLGLCFSLRTSGLLLGIDLYFGYEALSYLANSPAALFSVLFLCGCGLSHLSRAWTMRRVLTGAGLIFLGLVIFIPVVMTSQRASMAAFIVYNILVFGFLFIKAPRRMAAVGGVFALLTVVFMGDFLGEVFQGVLRKSAIVGDNQRIEDVFAVWSAISQNSFSMMFGLGWGASFESPAVMDIEVYFTHSLLSSMLLKLGVVGFLTCLMYVGALFWTMTRSFKGGFALVLALAAPFLVDVFLYAAFKSLDFGLLLLLISGVILFQKRDHVIASHA